MNLLFAYLGIVTVLIIALNARYFGELMGIMDDPKREAHKSHLVSTPLVGALMVGALCICMILNHFFFEASTRMIGIGTCTIMIAVLGLIDDRLQLGWKLRLGTIFVICLTLTYWVPELRLDKLEWSFGIVTNLGPIWGSAFTILCLMTLVISFNMMDGFNGGVITISLVLFILMALVATNPHRQAICLFLASALGIMLIYNLKGEFFLGDGGAYALGLLIGSVALLTYNIDANVKIYADTIFLWLTIPTVDCLRVVLKRMYKGESPFQSNRDHLHHILMQHIPKQYLFLFYGLNIALLGWVSIHIGSKVYLLASAQLIILISVLHFHNRRILQKHHKR
ncbi:glycosyltransferase family 4 protein [Kordiimonas laminariae]|uniref:glycosyltransferase family 4 protein n=1 Tax=Kordiimonas laminariae TaxID=2917717 RepID=UPI001FF47CA3|nr:MraY family glycosyltransferase [Kordiimonas laminariae]MCK0070289.1 undecaprenyl/decaprenyl-phosphate alpha-N-acetylglucosaminyl 1-phosphate transferase [Kordiimonas laminariae]